MEVEKSIGMLEITERYFDSPPPVVDIFDIVLRVLGVRPRQSKLTKALPRYKSGTRIPTLVVLEKYAAALGKRIELRLSDEE